MEVLASDLDLLAVVFIIIAIASFQSMSLPVLNDQVDATLKVMADAVTELQANVTALKSATTSTDTAAIAAAAERLRVGTDALAGAIAAARAAR